jgi:hypothetical protein
MIHFVKEEENQSLGQEDWRSIEMGGGIFEARKSWKTNICGGGWKCDIYMDSVKLFMYWGF